MNKISSNDLSYIAGFIDGEGCIGLHKGKAGAVRVMFEISQTKKHILSWIKKRLQCGRIYVRKAHNNSCKAYILSIFSREVRCILPVLRPYLRLKHKQADILIKFFSITTMYDNKSKVRKRKLATLLRNSKRLNKRGRR